MATGPRLTIDDALGQRSGGYHEAAFKALEHVDAIIDGQAVAIERAPWGDSVFQRAVIQRLREMYALREDSRKLAIVKEVFGGAR
jgi:ATP-dependent DNA ligase